MPGRHKRYPLHQCALYRCTTKKRLLKLLQTSAKKIEELGIAPDLYRRLEKKKKNGDPRIVYAPRHDLKRIQRRISELLMRLEPPTFLMAPVRGRSNIDNAARHRTSVSHHLLDIANFYPSCRASKVAEFFGRTLQYPADVVAILVRVRTCKSD